MKGAKHIEMLTAVARGLGNLKDDVVFIGGATVGIHITDPAAPEVRLSEDIDCVIEITTRNEYYALEKKLRRQGFKEPSGNGHPICRWTYSGIVVDVMPTDEKILGFTNRWYKDGIRHAKKIQLKKDLDIAVFSVPYLIASKIEAFKGRGKDDYLGSPDMEDIVALVDGCVELMKEIEQSDSTLKNYFKKELGKFLEKDRFIEAVIAHCVSLDPGSNRGDRAILLIKKIAGLKS